MLTEEQKRLLIGMIERGEPLPAEYRRLLFGQNGVELVERTGVYSLEYKGKAREQDILADTLAAPLQEIRDFNADNPNPDHPDWRNLLIYGDNLLALKALYEDQRGPNRFGTRNKIKLVYIDPPFATKQDFMKDREKAYRDKLIGAQFIEFLRKRLVLLREVLADDGSIYVHLDWKKSHYIKLVMDEVFGEENFVREIVWRIGWISGYKSAAPNWARNHDVIFYYKKGSPIFNKGYIPYPKGYTRRDGSVPAGQGYPLEDTWNCSDLDSLDSIQIMSFSGEKTGYPTQKNENVLERIIAASSERGDIVMDAFVGGGHLRRLPRRWIGVGSASIPEDMRSIPLRSGFSISQTRSVASNRICVSSMSASVISLRIPSPAPRQRCCCSIRRAPVNWQSPTRC